MIVAGVFLAVTLVAPALLGPLNKLWLRFGLLLHRVVSPLVLGYHVLRGRDANGLDHADVRQGQPESARARRRTGSYWIRRDPPGPKPDSLNNQF